MSDNKWLDKPYYLPKRSDLYSEDKNEIAEEYYQTLKRKNRINSSSHPLHKDDKDESETSFIQELQKSIENEPDQGIKRCDDQKTYRNQKSNRRSILSQEGNTTTSEHIRNAISEAHEKNMLILPDGSLVSTDGHVTRLNNNIIALGTSGGGKTRSVVIPNILAANESMIISDPKGTLYELYGEYLESYGYRVLRLDLINPERSDGYNPLSYVQSSDEIIRLAHQICYSDGENYKSPDPFWDKADELLITALIAYLVESVKIGQTSCNGLNISEVIRLLELIDANEMEEKHTCVLDRELEYHKRMYRNKTGHESWAFRQWRKFRQTPDRTLDCILITTNAMLARLDTDGIKQMMQKDTMMMEMIGEIPTAIFVEVSDIDRSKDLLANIFYSQAMTELCKIADNQPDYHLKMPVRFILDDFGTTIRIEGFQNMISNIRSRGISAMIVLQSLSQLAHGYGTSAHTIIENCDTLLYMGGNDLETASYIAQRSGKSLKSTIAMPVGMHWQFRRGQDSKICNTIDLSEYSFCSKKQKHIKRN
ncbi:VirD4-like conjugal transfer protein, CD1115 family [Ruminococcus sp.]|uniref:VirD4-like conjugal transfer protein, CD1115 family n=1 Tax=Ruminococcus sp. TaxID=41978 RepID=UPI0025ECF413|nr:type IV secretory system conjugative DNA transfer family protein [Ruminococcus sp.]